MRLLSIQLNNFQAHGQTLIEFAPAITTIKGPTDAGKSAILRALRWVCLNDIAGDAFIKEGEKRTQVTISVREAGTKTSVIRSKGSSHLNSYHFQSVEFKAFGMSVPADIAKLLRLSELNFQSQHDSPFWFNESAAEVSRRLNSIVDLSVIDDALSNIASAVRLAQERKTVSAERLDQAQREYETVKDAEIRVAEFKALKDTHEKSIQAEADHYKLDTLLGKVLVYRDQLRVSRERGADSQAVFSLCGDYCNMSKKLASLNAVLGSLRSYSERSTPPPSFVPVEKAFQAWQEVENRIVSLATLVDNIQRAGASVRQLNAKASACEKRFHQETKGIECPLCGRRN